MQCEGTEKISEWVGTSRTISSNGSGDFFSLPVPIPFSFENVVGEVSQI